MTYATLKAKLIETFSQRESEYLSRLIALKRGSLTLEEYVTKFRKLRNQAALSNEREDT